MNFKRHGVYLEGYLNINKSLPAFTVYWYGTPIAETKTSKKGWSIFKAQENKRNKRLDKDIV